MTDEQVDPLVPAATRRRRYISKRLRFLVLHRDGFRCVYCGASPPGSALHVEHVVALANGGADELSNLASACDDCNLGKGTARLQTLPLAVSERVGAQFFATLFGFNPNDLEAVDNCLALIRETDAAVDRRRASV